MFKRKALPPLSPDNPELRLLAQLAGVAPTRMAAALSDPENLYQHISLEEIERIVLAAERFKKFCSELAARAAIATTAITRGTR